MNRKGFTLIELLAVIVILGIILTFAVPSITNIYKESKLKTEKAFVDQLSKGIESYITLYSNEMSFSKVDGNFVKEIIDNRSDKPSYDVDVYKADITVKDIIEKNDLFTLFEKEFRRVLSQKEITTIAEWDRIYGYDKIVDALRIAVINRMMTDKEISFNYIGKILANGK